MNAVLTHCGCDVSPARKTPDIITTLVFILFRLLSDLFGEDTGVVTPATRDAEDRQAYTRKPRVLRVKLIAPLPVERWTM